MVGYILELYWDNGKENGNYYIMGYILELYWDSGKRKGKETTIIYWISPLDEKPFIPNSKR